MKRPSYTCPSIDSIKADIIDVMSALSQLASQLEIQGKSNTIVSRCFLRMSELHRRMEVIRSDDSSLRAYGDHWRTEYLKLEKEFNERERSRPSL